MTELRWPNYAPRNLVLEGSEPAPGGSAYVRDEQGNSYLDAVGGIGCVVLGHGHPAWIEAVERQARRLVAADASLSTRPQLDLCARLVERVPVRDARVFLCNTGTEATEAALKLSLRATGRDIVVAFDRAFHGRTIGSIALTAKPEYRSPYVSCMGEDAADRFASAKVLRLPFDDIEAARHAFAEHGRRIAAVFIEPVQGEAGVYPASREFLLGLRDLCNRHAALLGLDEIQCGSGRTGSFTAWQAIVGNDPETFPDLVWLAKGLGGGFPIGACLARRDLAAKMTRGTHGTTFGGNPLACAAALATLEIMERERLMESAAAQIDTLHSIANQEPIAAVQEIRGLGAMIGIQIGMVEDQAAEGLLSFTQQERVLVTVCAGHTVRFLLPYRAGRTELAQAWSAVGRAIDARDRPANRALT